MFLYAQKFVRNAYLLYHMHICNRIISNMYDHESLVGKESPIYGEVIRYDTFCDL